MSGRSEYHATNWYIPVLSVLIFSSTQFGLTYKNGKDYIYIFSKNYHLSLCLVCDEGIGGGFHY